MSEEPALDPKEALLFIRALIRAREREVSSRQADKEPPLDAKEALIHIRTLARAAQDSDDAALLRKHVEMILVLVDKALPRGQKLRG